MNFGNSFRMAWLAAVAAAALAAAGCAQTDARRGASRPAVPAAAGPADTILVNGRIVTVDDYFSIAQAVAIKGSRILDVGGNDDIRRLAGPGTKVIDLGGRMVIPGLIDNHAHFIRVAEKWHYEMRLDGVTSRSQVLRMIADRARVARPGEWIVALGGWSEEQFTDDPRGFPLEELDRIAPNNPVALQAVYRHTYLNTAGLKAAGIDENTPDPRGGTIEKDKNGKPTGVVRGAGGVAFVAAKVPLAEKQQWLKNARDVVAYLNSVGMTAWMDAGGRGMSDAHYGPYRELADRGELNIRAFWLTIRQPTMPQHVDKVVAEIRQLKPFQGTDYFNHVGYGETVYGPANTALLSKTWTVKPEDMQQVRRIAAALAERGIYLNAHVEHDNMIHAFLDEFEAVNREHPIKGLRWSFSHLDQINASHIERMKRLGMNAQIHTRPLIQGVLMHRVHGERAWDMPPMRLVQDSGIMWGLGSDATAVTTSNPFYNLWFAVTGKMVGGHKVNRQTITREEALIAHTRNNAYIIFQESNLGSIQRGKYADLVVLDRDYFAIPEDEIKDIKPLMTMVGGKIVYERK
ncbi:MAG TPA: amidohydrolase [Burkholderiales bacterium]|nr:amidohydrolase [Burkholderiales bacterium]